MTGGAVYVDDGGNPGQDSGSDFLPPSRKSWTAVIVPQAVAAQVAAAMEIFISGVCAEHGAKELHFTDVFSGKKAWKSVSVHRRIEIFDLMGQLMDSFGLPVVHITTSAETLLDHPELAATFKRKEGVWWDISNLEHFGFLRLCSKVAQYLREFQQDAPNDFQFPMPLFVDEGLLKAGGEATLPSWADVLDGPKAKFRRSIDVPGIQLADFAAFSLNRSQWIAAKHEVGQPVTDAEREFLRTTNSAQQRDPARDLGPRHNRQRA